jgi:hypothetical protein
MRGSENTEGWQFSHPHSAGRTGRTHPAMPYDHPAWSIRAIDVITVVDVAAARYGIPEHLRSKPGRPWEDGHIESFHDKLRDECLNRELFGNLEEARVILESWCAEYKNVARRAAWLSDP